MKYRVSNFCILSSVCTEQICKRYYKKLPYQKTYYSIDSFRRNYSIFALRPIYLSGMSTHYAINLGRELGSGGRAIGELVARQLGIAFYDKELLCLASQESGLGQEFFEKADERTSPALFGSMMGGRFPFMNEAAFLSPSCLSNDSLFNIQSKVIEALVEKKSCLFVGRCADYVLRNHPRCVNIFVTSPLEIRKSRLMERMQITATEAEELIRKSDKMRSNYYNYYSFRTWGQASTYHLCIDSSIFGIEETANFITAFIKKKLAL